MKTTITNAALARIDRLDALADTVRLVQKQILEAVGAELAVEEWDAQVWTRLERRIARGDDGGVDEFLARELKVGISDAIDGT